MTFKEKTTYSLPVIEKIEEGKNEFYIVRAGDKDYKIKLYDFQKNRPVPEKLLCHAMSVQDDGIVFTQDYSMFLNEFYKIGEIYPFKVVSSHTNSYPPYYKVRDKNGFSFRLQDFSGARLREHEDVECKVMHLDGYKLRLKLVKYKEVASVPFYTVEQLAKIIDEPLLGRFLKKLLFSDPSLDFILNLYKEERGEWILKFLKKIYRDLDPKKISRPRLAAILQALTKISLFLLEGSAYLQNLDDKRRGRWRDRLENYVRQYATLSEAIRLMDCGKDIEIVDEILSKMKNSGYLFNPAEKLALLISIFSLRPEIVDEKMTLLLEIITGGNHSNWMQDPFRSAFIKQLDYYVQLTKEAADRASYDDHAGRELLRKMIQTLAIRRLMTRNADADRIAERAALYRYLTYENNSLGTELLEKAFLAVTDSLNNTSEFRWNDVADPKKISVPAAKPIDSSGMSLSSLLYEGENASLYILGNHIHISPSLNKKEVKPILPPDLLPWHNLQVYSSGKIPMYPAGEPKLERLRTFWQDVQTSLIDSPQKARIPKITKHAPELGEEVDIIIESTNDGVLFSCRIIDDVIEGTGFIELDELSPYIKTTPQYMSAFANDQGQPLLLRAKVTGFYPDGTPLFSLLPLMKEYIDTNLHFGERMECMFLSNIPNYVDRDNNRSKGYIGFSTYGDSVVCLFDGTDPQIKNGEYAEVEYQYVSETGQAVCKFIKRTDPTESDGTPKFNRQAAFFNFLDNYSGNRVLEEETQPEDEEDDMQLVAMEYENVRELIRIIDRVATLENNHVRMYNYLSFCHLLSVIIGDTTMADYYVRRLNFLRSLETFVDSGYIDIEEFKLDEEGYMDFPLIRMRARQMRVLSYFDRPEKNDLLWEIIRTEPVESTVALAKLALLSNMSMEFKLSDEVRSRVNREMSELMNIELKLPELHSFGSEETQELEFKASYLYDQQFHYNPDGQRDHILERICGFLNSATGGKLYIGVNNYGFASGLEEDMKSRWFQGNGSRDKFDLKVRNDIRSKLGAVANDKISTEWIDAGGKDVYVITIPPSQSPVAFHEKYWTRQGTSTYPYDFSTIQKLFTSRATAIQNAARESMESAKLTQQAADAPEAIVENIAAPEPVVAIENVVIEEVTPTYSPSTPQQEVKNNQTLNTGKLRSNSRNDWEENFHPWEFCINFFAKNFAVSDETNWETEDYLTIRKEEMDKWVVLVYADGGVIRIPVDEFNRRDRNVKYSRYFDKELIFACVAALNDKFMIRYNVGNAIQVRLEEVADLLQGGMTDTPASLTTGAFDSVADCEIIPAEKASKLKPLWNITRTKAGKEISATQAKYFAAIGIQI